MHDQGVPHAQFHRSTCPLAIPSMHYDRVIRHEPNIPLIKAGPAGSHMNRPAGGSCFWGPRGGKGVGVLADGNLGNVRSTFLFFKKHTFQVFLFLYFRKCPCSMSLHFCSQCHPVEFKKCQYHPVKFKKYPCHPIDLRGL